MPTLLSSATADLHLLDAFWREPVERTVLPNGLTLILKADRSAALASVQVWVKTGSIHEDAHLGAGLSHYLEHMLFKGSPRVASGEFSRRVAREGGNDNAFTSRDVTGYFQHVEASRLDLIAMMEADRFDDFEGEPMPFQIKGPDGGMIPAQQLSLGRNDLSFTFIGRVG